MENSPISQTTPICSASSRWREFRSSVGCGVAVVVLAALHKRLLLPGVGFAILLVSIGASAVLVFGTPHSPFSATRAVLGGHALSAFVGVCCASWIPIESLAAGAAVGLSLAAMRLCRCLHPPAGSSALLAVMGGESIRALGFSFVLNPVLLNVVLLCLLSAILTPFRTRFDR